MGDRERLQCDVFEGEMSLEAASVIGLVELQCKAANTQQTMTLKDAICLEEVLTIMTE